MKTKKYRAKI